MTDVTKIYDKRGLEIEFIIGKAGAGIEPSLKTNLGVTAQALRHVEVLKRHAIPFSYLGMRVLAPSPEAYIAHKMAINQQRGKKSAKDEQAILNMWPYLNPTAFSNVLKTLTKKKDTL